MRIDEELMEIWPNKVCDRDIDKRATEYRGSMSNQLTIFSRGAFVMVCKG